MNVTLSDGTVAAVPDGLSDDAIKNFTTRLEAANSNAKSASAASSQSQGASEPSLWDKVVAWGNQTPAQALGFAPPSGASSVSVPVSNTPPELLPETQPLFPRDQYPGVAAATDWIKANILRSTPVNFVGNVGADIAAMPWDAPASISNAILHTAQNFGYASNEPSMPMAAPRIKADLGVTPLTDPWAQRAETAAQIAATGGGNLWSRLVSGVFGEAKGEAGSYVGGKIADATDPRLREGLETTGALTAQGFPAEKIVDPRTYASPDAPAKFNDAATVQNVTGAPKTPVTAGQLGGPFIRTIESWLGKLPGVGSPVLSAQANVEKQIRQTRDIAAQAVAGPNATVDTSPSAPGVAILNGVRDYVNSKIDNAKPQIDAIENQLGTQNTRGPGGGSAMVDVRGLVNDLQGLKTATDAAGNVRATVAPEVASQIDAEIANINRARQPENPALHAQLQGQINALQGFLGQAGVDPGVRAQVERQLQTVQAAQDANLKVPFEALRQMKTLQGAETFGDGTPTLNGYMGGKVYRAYGGALQGFANNLDPALGAQYAKATGDYNDAMDARRNFKNVIQGANENQLTSTMMGGLKGPESIKALAGTPVWNQAAANTIGMLGRTPSGAFDANQFAKQWNSATDAAKTFYTQGSPDMRRALDAAANLGAGFRSPGKSDTPLTLSALILTALGERALSHLSGEGLGGLATGAAAIAAPLAASAGLESRPFKRALAAPPQPWSLSIPALVAVAQQQGRNQGY